MNSTCKENMKKVVKTWLHLSLGHLSFQQAQILPKVPEFFPHNKRIADTMLWKIK